jgi:hypothetical protein
LAVVDSKGGAATIGSAGLAAGAQQAVPAKIHPQQSGRKDFFGRPSPGGDDSDARRIEMEMRIVVPPGGNTSGLADRLTAAFGADRICCGDRREEVGIRMEENSDRAVLLAVDVVERWLDHDGCGSAEMWLGENSYRLARWAPVEVWG